MIHAVIFDLGGVLVTDEWSPIYRILAAEIKSSEERVARIVKPLFRKWAINQITAKSFWEEFTNQSGAQLPDRFTRDFWIAAYKNLSKDISGTWDILHELGNKGIRLALLTNIIEPTVMANEEMGRFKRLREIGFEAFVYSYEVGCGKPCREMYETMLEKLHLPAEACVYTDDKEKNIEAAAELGMKSTLYQNSPKLRQDLVALGVL